MNALDLFGLRFALASCACVAAGIGVWGVTALCGRMLPVLSLQRSVWLLGQAVVAATFLLILMPQTDHLRAVTAIELADVMPAAFDNMPATSFGSPLQPVFGPEHKERAWMVYATRAWMLLYLLGLVWSLRRQLQAQLTVKRLVSSGVYLTADVKHNGFPDGPAPLPVIEVAAPISPMLVGPFSARLLLPLHLRDFDPIQQQLIIEHELTHWRRGDLHWMTMSVVLQTLFWFHPVMRVLSARLSWAQELACDRDVLRDRVPAQRKIYAAALVAQLTSQLRPVQIALAFGSVSPDMLVARIAMIRTPLTAAHGGWIRGIALGALATVFVCNLTLQPALAWQSAVLSVSSPAPLDCTEIVDANSGVHLLQQGSCAQRITPASTFNIVVSLMGFDSGILRDAHTPRLPYRAGYADWSPSWRTSTDPASWITNSTVWYAQQVTSQLGSTRLAHYLEGFDYGNRDASGDLGKNNGLTASWIGSSMQISPNEQIVFLRRIVNRQLPVSAVAFDVTSQLLKLPGETDGWQVYGKTGTASPMLSNGSEDTAHSYGWFVGWATKGTRTVVFARLLLDKTQVGSSAGPRVKAAFLRELPTRMTTLQGKTRT